MENQLILLNEYYASSSGSSVVAQAACGTLSDEPHFDLAKILMLKADWQAAGRNQTKSKRQAWLFQEGSKR